MSGKALGPNIALWAINFSLEDYAIHSEVCKGQIVQPMRRGRVIVPSGRAFCSTCKRLVGKKAWRHIQEMLDAGTLDWNNESYGRDVTKLVRIFFQIKPSGTEELVEGAVERACERAEVRASTTDARRMLDDRRDRSLLDRLRDGPQRIGPVGVVAKRHVPNAREIRAHRDEVARRQRDMATAATFRAPAWCGATSEQPVSAETDGEDEATPMFHIHKGDIHMDIPQHLLTYAAFKDLQECVETLDDDMGVAAASVRIEHWLRQAVERSKQVRQELEPLTDEHPLLKPRLKYY